MSTIMSTNGIAALNEFIMGVCVDTLSFQILHVLSYSFFFFLMDIYSYSLLCFHIAFCA